MSDKKEKVKPKFNKTISRIKEEPKEEFKEDEEIQQELRPSHELNRKTSIKTQIKNIVDTLPKEHQKTESFDYNYNFNQKIEPMEYEIKDEEVKPNVKQKSNYSFKSLSGDEDTEIKF